MSLKLQDMLFDFMRQITSCLDSIERKVDGNQQNLERLLKKIEKRKVCRTTFMIIGYFYAN